MNDWIVDFVLGIFVLIWEFVKLAIYLSLVYFWGIAIIQEDITSGDKAIIITLITIFLLYVFFPIRTEK